MGVGNKQSIPKTKELIALKRVQFSFILTHLGSVMTAELISLLATFICKYDSYILQIYLSHLASEVSSIWFVKRMKLINNPTIEGFVSLKIGSVLKEQMLQSCSYCDVIQYNSLRMIICNVMIELYFLDCFLCRLQAIRLGRIQFKKIILTDIFKLIFRF